MRITRDGVKVSAVRVVALVSAVTLATLCHTGSVSAGDKKVVGVTLLNLQYPYFVAVDGAIEGQFLADKLPEGGKV